MSEQKQRRKKNNTLSTILLVVIFLAGLSLLLYPTVSDWWNSMHQSRAVASYVEQVEDMSVAEKQRMYDEAVAYNEKLAQEPFHLELSEEEAKEYESILDITGTGIMGYVDIPKIDVQLPIYHGTDEGILQIAIGHLTGTSFPVGGKGTHAVMSGHRGLPSAKLFTNLDKLKKGDLFVLRVMDEVLTYEVDQILIVEPNQTEALMIDKDQDYCTLVTCTPYGINTHRLLVRGHRTANQDESKNAMVTADAIQIDPVIMTPLVAAPMLIVLLIVVLTSGSRKGKRSRRRDERDV